MSGDPTQMSDAEAARIRAIMATCEGPALDMLADAEMTTHQADRLCAYSRTLSLRRIADALEHVALNTQPRIT